MAIGEGSDADPPGNSVASIQPIGPRSATVAAPLPSRLVEMREKVQDYASRE
jgi:hypothetical protein